MPIHQFGESISFLRGKMLTIGVDLGGTKTELIALAPDGTELYRKRTCSPHNYNDSLNNITQMVLATEHYLQQKCAIGVGIPGVISTLSKQVKNANSTWLNGHTFDLDLGALLNREIKIANDANCFTLSESIDGAAQGAKSVFGIILGTGCGAGFAVNQQIMLGANSVTGEWGHNPLPWMTKNEFQSTRCFCGQYDCIETYISGSGLLQQANKFNGSDKKFTRVEDIIELKQQGDLFASNLLDKFYHRCARSLAHIINLIDPDVIVLGGGLSNIDDIYTEVPKMMSKFVFGGECQTQIVKNQHGDSSGVRGAAWLWQMKA